MKQYFVIIPRIHLPAYFAPILVCVCLELDRQNVYYTKLCIIQHSYSTLLPTTDSDSTTSVSATPSLQQYCDGIWYLTFVLCRDMSS